MQRILIVEDDRLLREGLVEVIGGEGYAVSAARDTAAAERVLEEHDIDLILLDIMLPGKDGITFCRELRRTSNIPVIFLTARDEEVDVVRSLDAGGDDYITKPFRLREVLSRIRAALRRSRGSVGGNVLKAGSFELDFTRRIVSKDRQQILLTPIEFRLFSVFMQNSGQVLTRKLLIQKIWDSGGDYIENNTLSVHISRLREKITDDSGDSLIKTIRGIGYRFDVREGR